MSEQHDGDEGQSGNAAYETRDVKIRPLVKFLVGLTIAIVAAYLIVLGVFRLFSARHAGQDAAADPAAVRRAALPPEQRLPAEPRIQSDPAGEYELLRRAEDEVLTTYGWVDRPAGVVRLPIDRAMELVLEQGLPVRQPASVSPAAGAPVPAVTHNGAAPAASARKK